MRATACVLCRPKNTCFGQKTLLLVLGKAAKGFPRARNALNGQKPEVELLLLDIGVLRPSQEVILNLRTLS